MNTEDYIQSHINRVQKRMSTIIGLMQYRMSNHDKSKLEEPEISLWRKMDEEPRYPYGSKEYKDKLKRFKKVFDYHYASNRHHPEHFSYGIIDMNLVDLLEMLCDWISYKDHIRVSEAFEMIEIQSKRFGFSYEITNLLNNTLKDYFVEILKNEEFEDLKNDPNEHLIDIYV